MGLVNDLLGHLARFHGQTTVRDLGRPDFFKQFRDYLVGLIAEKEMGPATPTRTCRQLKAIANRAATKGALAARNTFNDFLPEPKPRPHALSPAEIGKSARRSER